MRSKAVVVLFGLMSGVDAAHCTVPETTAAYNALTANVSSNCTAYLGLPLGTPMTDVGEFMFGLCQEPCRPDLARLSSVPNCDENVDFLAMVHTIHEVCANATHALADSRACSAGETELIETAGDRPFELWPNCSVGYPAARLTDFVPQNKSGFDRFCSLPTCRAFAMQFVQSLPDCILSDGFNAHDKADRYFSCAPAAPHTPCNNIDWMPFMELIVSPISSECATFAHLPPGATLHTLAATRDHWPAGMCSSPCYTFAKHVQSLTPTCNMIETPIGVDIAGLVEEMKIVKKIVKKVTKMTSKKAWHL
uniref:Secreted protein n=1 Tax=Achlya hypogyna TaxID=1202772 RepID=A0A0A7CNH2_ACHHY|nr:secreted protein [Achlya hypogyna]